MQGHDNRTFRLGNNMLIRMPTAEEYALKVIKEQELLLKLAPYLSLSIPIPLKKGCPSKDYPFHFSIYQYIDGESLNMVTLTTKEIEQLALDLAKFLKELQDINPRNGPSPGLHNWYRGDHITVYDAQAKDQIKQLANVIDADKAINL